MKNLNHKGAILLASVCGLLAACAPQTPAEKAKDKVEDAAHETGQAVERVGEKIKDVVQ